MSGADVRLLHVDGDEAFLRTVAEHLESVDDGIAVTTATATDAAMEHVRAGGVDCVLTGVAPPGSERLGIVERVAHVAPDVPVVVVGDGLEDGTAADALATGAAEFAPRSTAPGALHVLANRVRTVTAAGGRDRDAGAGVADGVAETLPVPVWVVRDGTVAFANEALASLVGRERDALVGLDAADVVAPADHGTLEEHLGTLVARETSERTDVVTVRGRWGERREVALHGRRATADGEPAVVGALVDVTEARLARRRLRTLLEGLEDPVADVRLEDGRAVVESVNEAFEATFGLAAGEAEGEPLDELVVPDEDGALEAALDAHLRLERGTDVVEEVPRATADGTRSLRLQGLPYEAGGDPHALMVYSPVGDGSRRERDLTALQSVARELMAAADRAEIATIGVEAAERVLDTELACLYAADDGGERLVPLAATDGAEALFGDLPVIEEGEAAAWYVHEMGDPLVTDDVRSLDTVYDRQTPVRAEMLLPVGDHGVFVVSATEPGAFDERDEALGRTLASTLEAALNRAEKERLLREREAELVRENERLEEFAGIVSHDLRSPLAVVKGNASLLRDSGDVEHLDRIEDAADRMEQLIEDLLSLARQGSMVEDPEPVALEDVVTRAWTTAETGDATLSADLDVEVAADRSRLRQLFENLFNNAVEHGGRDVTVEVGTVAADPERRTGGQYGRGLEGFYVADDGPGLPEDVEDLFDPGTTTEDDGTGFGLAIVERIAEAHGWEVTAGESAAGGARFEFTGVDGV